MTAAGESLRSLRIRNFRLWFIGQGISMIGFWGQAVAQALLVLDLTGSGSMLGFVTALRFAPILVVGPWAGVLSDRIDKRLVMLATQSSMMVFTLALGILVLTNTVTIGWVIALSALTGAAWAFDQPSRRTIVTELVGDDDATNAVSLNSALVHIAKVLGPSIAGLLIVVAGIGWCFVLNAATSVAVLIALLRMNGAEMSRSVPMKRGKGQIREGFNYVWTDRQLRLPMAMIGVVGVLSFNWNVLLPLFATRDLNGTAATYALLMGSMSVGSISGALWLARQRTVDLRFLAISCIAFGSTSTLLAVVPTVLGAVVCGWMVGASSMVYTNATVTSVQLGALPEMRGRVMSVFSMIWLGGLAIGGPIAGWLAERLTARSTLGFGACAATATGLFMLVVLRRTPTRVTRGGVVGVGRDSVLADASARADATAIGGTATYRRHGA